MTIPFVHRFGRRIWVCPVPIPAALLLLGASVGTAFAVDNGMVFPRGYPLVTNAIETNTLYPFLVNELGLIGTPPPQTFRYQQVFDSTLFDNISSGYVFKLELFLRPLVPGAYGPVSWTLTNMQINLSTTTRSAGNLSPVFSENVGLDDQVVFGPGRYTFTSAVGPNGGVGFDLIFDRSFHFDPSRGNLLVDVRILDVGSYVPYPDPALEAFETQDHEVARSWSTNVFSTAADGMDDTGLTCILALAPDAHVSVPAPKDILSKTFLPFLIQQTYSPFLYPSNVPVSIRYQQVYSSNSFTNVDPSLIYLTALQFQMTGYYQWTVTNLQISVSTTQKGPGNLSPVFADNIGPDEVVVLRPQGRSLFSLTDFFLPFYFTQPFRYDPGLGNLLLDISLSATSGQCCYDLSAPSLAAFTTPTNLASRAWSTNSASRVASSMDSTALTTIFQFSGGPSLSAEFFPIAYGGETNIIEISWPSQPSVFQLQSGERAGTNIVWRGATNEIFGSPEGGGRFIWLQRDSAAASSLYRLVWPSGQ